MIPRRFHRVWVGGPMPEHLARYGQTWVEHHPDWEHLLWTEKNMPLLRNQAIYDDAERITPNNVGQLRADIARYELVHEHGGVFIDADLECRRPIDPLLDGVECFAGWEDEGRWVNNAILGATPRHPFLAALIDGLAENVRRKLGTRAFPRPNVLTGPQYLTPLYRRFARSVTVFPKAHFYPYSYRELARQDERFPDSYAVHHWNNARRKVSA